LISNVEFIDLDKSRATLGSLCQSTRAQDAHCSSMYATISNEMFFDGNTNHFAKENI